MPSGAHLVARIGRPGSGRARHRPIRRCPTAHPSVGRTPLAHTARHGRRRAKRCHAVRPAPGWASNTRTWNPPRSVNLLRSPRQKRAARVRPNAVRAHHLWQSPAGWSTVTPRPTGRKNPHRAAARRPGNQCETGAACGGTKTRSRCPRPAPRNAPRRPSTAARCHRLSPRGVPRERVAQPAPDTPAPPPAGDRSDCRCPRSRHTSASAAHRSGCRTNSKNVRGGAAGGPWWPT